MINRKTSVHLQDFPDTSFLDSNQELVADMDLVRAICSTALSIRDNKNLRVRLPLNELKVIGKIAPRILPFKEIIAEEVNVKNIIIEEKIEGTAELKLQINFKKIGVKYGSRVKEITDCARKGEWKKIGEKEIEIAGIKLIDDEFEIKLMTNNQNDKKFVIAALQTNDCLVSLDIEVTQELADEGIARDIVRAIQQSRKTADLNVSDRIEIILFSPNKMILQVAEKFSSYITAQVLGLNLKAASNIEEVKSKAKFFSETKIDDGEIAIGINN
ncbi:MAG: hypothetical protein EXR06_03265 [Rickettsiales bacterium]|nr:hypothetical protein [Rickettsiales bacterium]